MNYVMLTASHMCALDLRGEVEGGWRDGFAALCVRELEMMSFIEAQRG